MTRSPVKSTRGLALIVASCAVAAGMLSATSPALATPDVNDGSVAAATPTPDPAATAAPPAVEAPVAPTTRSGSKVFAKTGKGPDGIAVDALGNVYTANSRANTVTKVTTASGKASTLGVTGKTPRGIAVDSSGNVYTSNLADNTVTKITSGGTSSVLGTTGAKPIDVAVDSAGNVYTTNYADSTVQDHPGGASSVLGATGSRPLGITLDPQGNVYTANEGANTVTKITPAAPRQLSARRAHGRRRSRLTVRQHLYGELGLEQRLQDHPKREIHDLRKDRKEADRPRGRPYGAVFTTNDGANTVSKISRTGRAKVIASTGRRPIGIASDAAGFLYTANFLSNTITEIYPTPKGSPNV